MFKKIVFVVLIVSVAWMVLLSLYYMNSTREQGGDTVPVHLIIPKISLDSVVEQVGFTKTGAMDTPKVLLNVGWFKYGVRPGEVGSAVIAGHYGWKNKKPSAFDNLSKVRVGDAIYVENNKKELSTFIVRKIKKYDPKTDAVEVFSSSDGLAHLNLITCDGVWDVSQKSYTSRLVVFTDKK